MPTSPALRAVMVTMPALTTAVASSPAPAPLDPLIASAAFAAMVLAVSPLFTPTETSSPPT